MRLRRRWRARRLKQMDVSAISGARTRRRLSFVEDFLQLRFDGPWLTLYPWPKCFVLKFSVAYGEPEYRNVLCAQIGESVSRLRW